jgi:hypothetical protein
MSARGKLLSRQAGPAPTLMGTVGGSCHAHQNHQHHRQRATSSPHWLGFTLLVRRLLGPRRHHDD